MEFQLHFSDYKTDQETSEVETCFHKEHKSNMQFKVCIII